MRRAAATLAIIPIMVAATVQLANAATSTTCHQSDLGHSKTVAGHTYVCRGKSNATFLWEEVSPGGGNQSNQTGSTNSNGAPAPSGMKCSSATPLSVVPIDPAKTQFTPLGNINPPGHIVLSTHGGLMVPSHRAPAGAPNAISGQIPEQVPVRLPADIAKEALVQVTSVKYSNGTSMDDFAIHYNVCGSIYISLGHFIHPPVALIQQMKKQYPNPECQNSQNVDSRAKVSTSIKLCFYPALNFQAPAGTVIGTSGPALGVDFGAWDTSKPLALASFDNYPQDGEGRYAICALDLFPPTLKSKVKAPQGCGSATADVVGTASGAWFEPGNAHAIFQQHVIELAALSMFPGQYALATGALVPPGVRPNSLYKISKDPALIKAGSLVCLKGTPAQQAFGNQAISVGIQVIEHGSSESLVLSDCGGKSKTTFERTLKLGPA